MGVILTPDSYLRNQHLLPVDSIDKDNIINEKICRLTKLQILLGDKLRLSTNNGHNYCYFFDWIKH